MSARKRFLPVVMILVGLVLLVVGCGKVQPSVKEKGEGYLTLSLGLNDLARDSVMTENLREEIQIDHFNVKVYQNATLIASKTLTTINERVQFQLDSGTYRIEGEAIEVDATDSAIQYMVYSGIIEEVVVDSDTTSTETLILFANSGDVQVKVNIDPALNAISGKVTLSHPARDQVIGTDGNLNLTTFPAMVDFTDVPAGKWNITVQIYDADGLVKVAEKRSLYILPDRLNPFEFAVNEGTTQYTLNLEAEPGGTTTPIAGSNTYDENTMITLTATPESGNTFIKWIDENGDLVTEENPYTFYLNCDQTVRAVFNLPPEITSITNVNEYGQVTIDEMQELRLTVEASDPDQDQLTYQITGIDANFFTQENGNDFFWTPNLNAQGTYNVTIEITDGILTMSQDITITVNDIPDQGAFVQIHDGPAQPTGITATVEGDGIRLNWTPNNETDFQGYLIYRGQVSDGSNRDYLNNQLITDSSYYDTNIVFGQNYYYWVEAFDQRAFASPMSESVYIAATHAPVIESISNITDQGIQINRNQTLRLEVIASDPENDNITFDWETSIGSITDFGSGVVDFNSLDQPGTGMITLTLTDDHGAQVTREILVTVLNQEPQFTNFYSNPEIEEGRSANFTAYAQDPDGDNLTYEWSISPGGGTFYGSGHNIYVGDFDIYQDKTYTVTVVVSDGYGGTATHSFSLTVYAYPWVKI